MIQVSQCHEIARVDPGNHCFFCASPYELRELPIEGSSKYMECFCCQGLSNPSTRTNFDLYKDLADWKKPKNAKVATLEVATGKNNFAEYRVDHDELGRLVLSTGFWMQVVEKAGHVILQSQLLPREGDERKLIFPGVGMRIYTFEKSQFWCSKADYDRAHREISQVR